jgi:hypothetical protein
MCDSVAQRYGYQRRKNLLLCLVVPGNGGWLTRDHFFWSQGRPNPLLESLPVSFEIPTINISCLHRAVLPHPVVGVSPALSRGVLLQKPISSPHPPVRMPLLVLIHLQAIDRGTTMKSSRRKLSLAFRCSNKAAPTQGSLSALPPNAATAPTCAFLLAPSEIRNALYDLLFLHSTAHYRAAKPRLSPPSSYRRHIASSSASPSPYAICPPAAKHTPKPTRSSTP